MKTVQSDPGTLAKGQFELIAKALADPRRMALLESISEAKGGECACQRLLSLFPVTKGTVSHHMKELDRAGLISSMREGQFMKYQVRHSVLRAYTLELTRRMKLDSDA
ncbi:MAG TPA: metalloregulator ArsR/SmtB family transcription factor [Gemmatimonadales bacterium]|nr:metalloregulator ArsR/SmtB family transcription factor [Gemmatimonadales bacterium]